MAGREPEPGTDQDREDREAQERADERAGHDPETEEDTASGGPA